MNSEWDDDNQDSSYPSTAVYTEAGPDRLYSGARWGKDLRVNQQDSDLFLAEGGVRRGGARKRRGRDEQQWRRGLWHQTLISGCLLAFECRDLPLNNSLETDKRNSCAAMKIVTRSVSLSLSSH